MNTETDLGELRSELIQALLENRPAKWLSAEGNGVDFSTLPLNEQCAAALGLLREVEARIEGKRTPAQALGEAIERMNRGA